ncbi:MAG: hypothetical protein RMM51_10290 [Verrucomicrobiae bacterium]|nr:hypothetical protein [Verrucomicrobiae bacterium]
MPADSVMTRRWVEVLVVMALGLLIGCKSIRAVRIVPPDVPLDFEGRVRLLRQLAAEAESADTVTKRKRAAERGLGIARQLREEQPQRVEGHYWYAIHAGLLAQADNSYGLTAVAEMDSALQRAIELDAAHDHCGPLRVRGLLLVRAPGPPVSMGSPRRGLRLLEQAAERCPEYGENLLYVAEALHATGKTVEALAVLQRLEALPAGPESAGERQRWLATAEAYRREWQK